MEWMNHPTPSFFIEQYLRYFSGSNIIGKTLAAQAL